MAKNANIKAAIQNVRDQLDSLNTEIAGLHEQRRKIANAPRPRKDAKAAISDKINAQAAAGRKRLAEEAVQLAAPGTNRDLTDLLVKWIWGKESYKPDEVVIMACVAREMEQIMHAAVDADPRFDGGISDNDRERQIKELDSQIANAETRRETLEHELSEAGLLPGAGDDAEESAGGDRGMRALHEQHERNRQAKNAELAAAGAKQQPRVIRVFDKNDRITVGG